jgi:mannose-6-phosphate isomerase-like protein (cupin superfamily)
VRILTAALVVVVSYAAFPAGQVPAPSASRAAEGMPARPQAVPIPVGRRVFYSVDEIPKLEFGPGVWRRTVAGEHVTFSFIDLDSRIARGVPISKAHHHDYEQFLWGLSGAFEQYVGGQTGTVAHNILTAAPPNVAHTLAGVTGPGMVTAIEFMPIVRTDLLPPKPAVTFPAAPEARPLAPGSVAFAEFDKMPWIGESGQARFKAVLGETSSFILWELPPASMNGTAGPGHHHTAEQISYVIEGHADARIGDQVARIGPGTLLMIPSDVDHLPMKAVNGETVLLLDFQPIVREDLRKRMGEAK